MIQEADDTKWTSASMLEFTCRLSQIVGLLPRNLRGLKVKQPVLLIHDLSLVHDMIPIQKIFNVSILSRLQQLVSLITVSNACHRLCKCVRWWHGEVVAW